MSRVMDAKHDDQMLDGAWKAKTKIAAIEYGLTLHSEPFGRRGVCIDVWKGDVKLGYRKSWKAAYALACTAAPAPEKA
jgi:hypothetical protein